MIFLVASLGFSMYSILLSANSGCFTSFPSWIPFICLLGLLWLLGLSKLCWIIVCKSGSPYLIPDLRGNTFRFFNTENNVCYGFVIYGLYYVEVGSLGTHSVESFYHKWVLNLVKILWFLFFKLLIWCITLTDLHMLKNPCLSGINPTWSWRMTLLMCFWIQFASILLRIFASVFISDMAL